jgi:hypothetical protein
MVEELPTTSQDIKEVFPTTTPITFEQDSRKFLNIIKDYPCIWNDRHPDYMDKANEKYALTEILKRYGKTSYNENMILQRLTRCRSHIVAFVKKNSSAGDDVLFEKLSRSVYPFYMFQYLNYRNDLGISEEVSFFFRKSQSIFSIKSALFFQN